MNQANLKWFQWGGGTDVEKGYMDVRPWRPPSHAAPVVRKGPISSKRVSWQDLLLRKFGNSSLYSLNFCPNFNSQARKSEAPKFGHFQFTSPKLGNFQFTSPLFQRQISVHKPHTNPGSTPLPSLFTFIHAPNYLYL